MKITDLSFSYGDKIIFRHYSWELPEPVCCITSPSGTGKSTLLRLIAGLLVPDSGTITGVPSRPVMMFQEDRLLPWYNVRKNLLLVCPDRDKTDAMLEAVEISGDLSVSELSGGMSRRVALARALLAGGNCLLLDEPFTGMDSDLMRRMAGLILSADVPVVAATHSPAEAEALGAKLIPLI